MSINVKVLKMYEDVIVPEQATSGSAGFDIRVRLPKDTDEESTTFGEQLSAIVLKPGETIKLSTGLKFELPENHVLLIFPRGSMGIKKGLMLQNTIGVLDEDYRGECFIFVKNISNDKIIIEHNERLCQGIVLPYPKVNFVQVNELSETDRGEGKEGSTGKF
jgi:dUTP pyrophosphatase